MTGALAGGTPEGTDELVACAKLPGKPLLLPGLPPMKGKMPRVRFMR